MKKRISTTYNTDTATLVYRHEIPYEDDPDAAPYVEDLYRTPKGAWFVDATGYIDPLTPDDARKWLRNDKEMLFKYFPEPISVAKKIKHQEDRAKSPQQPSVLERLLILKNNKGAVQ